MVEFVLHAGTGHVNLWLILLPALAAFLGGLALGGVVRSTDRTEGEAIDGAAPPSDDPQTE